MLLGHPWRTPLLGTVLLPGQTARRPVAYSVCGGHQFISASLAVSPQRHLFRHECTRVDRIPTRLSLGSRCMFRRPAIGGSGVYCADHPGTLTRSRSRYLGQMRARLLGAVSLPPVVGVTKNGPRAADEQCVGLRCGSTCPAHDDERWFIAGLVKAISLTSMDRTRVTALLTRGMRDVGLPAAYPGLHTPQWGKPGHRIDRMSSSQR